MTCTDIDECVVTNGGCALNASCTNTQGGRTCACRAGFIGDGVSCTDIDECAVSNGGCALNASCTNTQGGRTCACRAGFTGDGVSCTDIDECAVSNGGCALNASCTNTPGSRTCACLVGHAGDGFSCAWLDPSLAALSVMPGVLVFNPQAQTYSVPVPSGSSTVSVTATVPYPAGVTITIGGRAAQSSVATRVPLAGLVTTTEVAVTAQAGAMRRTSLAFIRQDYLKASNAEAFDDFGTSVAVSADGSTLAIGVPSSDVLGLGGVFNCGAVSVFVRRGDSWVEQSLVRASYPGYEDGLGVSVALSADGNTLVVGAPAEDSDATGVNGNQASEGRSDSGAAYVFTRTGTTWSQQAYLKATNSGAFDSFGASVSISSDGDTVVVGAPYEDGVGDAIRDSGASYVFKRTGGAWAPQALLRAGPAGVGDFFGWRVALSGDGSTLAVGAHNEDDGAMDSGAAFVFTSAGTTWAQQARLKASNRDALDSFGRELALNATGDVLTVSAPGEDSASAANPLDNSASRSGAVYVFVRTGSSWVEEALLKRPSLSAFDELGAALALSADGATLAVGGNFESAQLYSRVGGLWVPRPPLTPSVGTDPGDRFGVSLAMSADTAFLVAGAPGEDGSSRVVNGDWSDNSRPGSGAAWVFGL